MHILHENRPSSRLGAIGRIAAPLFIGVQALLPQVSQAAGFQLTSQNASGLGSVFAGQAALADDASTVWFNPAGMAFLDDPRQAVVAGQYVKSRSDFSSSGSCTPYLGTAVGTTACPFGPSGNLGHPAGSDGNRSPATAEYPNLYLTWPLIANTLFAGIGVNAPFGLKTDYGDNWVGRFQATESKTSAININPALAYKFDRFAFGVGLDVQRFDAELSNEVSYTAVAVGSGVPALAAAVGPGAEGLSKLKGHDWAVGWNAGVNVAVLDTLHVAATYRASIHHDVDGNIQFANRPTALSIVPQIGNGGASVSIRLPSSVSLAASWVVVPDVTLMLDWTRTNWSSIQDLRIYRTDGPLAGALLTDTALRLKDTHRVGFGAAWHVSGPWTVRTGIETESSSVDDRYRSPILPDTDRLEYGFGVRFDARPDTFDVGALFLKPRHPSIALVNQAGPTSLPQGSLNGSTATSALVVGAQWTRRF